MGNPAGPLPGLEALVGKSTAEINLLLRRFNLSEDRGALLAEEVKRSLGQLSRAEMADPALVERAIGRAESTVRRQLMLIAKRAIREVEQEELGEGILEWQAVGDGGDEKSCQSCIKRDGEKRPAADWDRLGRPGSDNLICNGNCRCVLVEAEVSPQARDLVDRLVALRESLDQVR